MNKTQFGICQLLDQYEYLILLACEDKIQSHH